MKGRVEETLQVAAEKQQVGVVKTLQAKGKLTPDVCEEGLRLAAEKGAVALASELLEVGANHNAYDAWIALAERTPDAKRVHQTPLGLAVLAQQTEIVKLLLEKGATVDFATHGTTTIEARTPLVHAIEACNPSNFEKYKDIIVLLLQKGAKLYHLPTQQFYRLMREGHIPLLQVLLANGLLETSEFQARCRMLEQQGSATWTASAQFCVEAYQASLVPVSAPAAPVGFSAPVSDAPQPMEVSQAERAPVVKHEGAGPC